MYRGINNISEQEAIELRQFYLEKLKKLDAERVRILTIIGELDRPTTTPVSAKAIEIQYPFNNTWVEKIKHMLFIYGPQTLGEIVNQIHRVEGVDKNLLMRSISATLSDHSKDNGIFTKEQISEGDAGRPVNRYYLNTKK